MRQTVSFLALSVVLAAAVVGHYAGRDHGSDDSALIGAALAEGTAKAASGGIEMRQSGLADDGLVVPPPVGSAQPTTPASTKPTGSVAPTVAPAVQPIGESDAAGTAAPPAPAAAVGQQTTPSAHGVESPAASAAPVTTTQNSASDATSAVMAGPTPIKPTRSATAALSAVGLKAAETATIAPIITRPEHMTLVLSRSKLMSVSGNPGAIVIGDPNIVDVTMQQDLLIVQPKGLGTTDVTILDMNNRQVAAWMVEVVRPDVQVNVYRPDGLETVSCGQTCNGAAGPLAAAAVAGAAGAAGAAGKAPVSAAKAPAPAVAAAAPVPGSSGE